MVAAFSGTGEGTMPTITRNEWKPYFDSVTETLVGKRAEVEVASLELGDQIVAESLPLLGITYDTQNDLLDIALGGQNQLTHLIRHPLRIEVTEDGNEIRNIAVATEDGVQVIR